MAGFLKFLGITAIILGIIAMTMIIHESSKDRASMWGGTNRGELEFWELLVALIVLFYHLALGTLCLSQSQLIESQSPNVKKTKTLSF